MSRTALSIVSLMRVERRQDRWMVLATRMAPAEASSRAPCARVESEFRIIRCPGRQLFPVNRDTGQCRGSDGGCPQFPSVSGPSDAVAGNPERREYESPNSGSLAPGLAEPGAILWVHRCFGPSGASPFVPDRTGLQTVRPNRTRDVRSSWTTGFRREFSRISRFMAGGPKFPALRSSRLQRRYSWNPTV